MKLLLPFKGRNNITSIFGYRTLNGTSDFHSGFDFVGIDSDIVRSPFDGTVGMSTIITDKSDRTWEWGNFVRIDGKINEENIYIFMCHLSERYVSIGDKVSVGQPIGRMGNTGYSFGAHTHVEIRNNAAVQLNPSLYFDIPNKVGVYVDSEQGMDDEGVNGGNYMTGEQIYVELMKYLSSMPESAWSKNEGGFAEVTRKGIMDGSNPRGFITREQLAAILYRIGLTKK